MSELIENPVYSKNVIEFVTVANEFCSFLEENEMMEKKLVIRQLQHFLPLVYLKTLMLPETQSLLDEGVDHFVTEPDYYRVQNALVGVIGTDDDYTQLFDADYSQEHEPVNLSISENIADVYQNLKDFIMNYRSGIEEIMNDSLWECHNNFKDYWGESLVNAIRAIHFLNYKKDWDGNDFSPEEVKTRRKKNFFENKQDQYNQEL